MPPPRNNLLRMSSAFGAETVLDVRHWTHDYFSFTTTRDDGFRFDNGQFVMIGLEFPQPDGTQRPLLRAYSIASANWEEQLEFFSIKAPGGALTSNLQRIKPDGGKFYVKDARATELHMLIGEPGDEIAIAEGYGTGAVPHTRRRLRLGAAQGRRL